MERSSNGGSSSTRGQETRKTFSSTWCTIVSLLGYSIGMSDIWRFPFLVYRNGGGAFLIPFILIVFLCGVPLYFLEYSLSKFAGKGPYQIWDISPFFRGTAYSVVLAYSLYTVIISVFRSWIAEFLVNSFQTTLPWSTCKNTWNTDSCREHKFVESGIDTVPTTISNIFYSSNGESNVSSWLNTTFRPSQTGLHVPGGDSLGMTAAEEFWQYKVLELSDGVTDFGAFHWKYVLYHAITRIVVAACCYKSIKSIEKVMFLSMFGPLLIIIAIFIRSLTLPGALDGIGLFFHFDFSKLQDPRLWVEAATMAFYTLSFGWGVVILLGSHAIFKENSVRVTTIIPILDATMAIFTGLVSFSVLGNMAHAIGSPVERVVQAGLSIGLVTLPTAIAEFPAPQAWSVLFFIALLLQGLDSQIAAVEMAVQVIGQAFPKLLRNKRTLILILLNLVILLVGLPLCTQAGGYIFLFLDWYTGVWLGPIVALIEVFTVLWLYGGDRFSYDVSLMTGKPIPATIRIALSFIAPVIVAILLGVSMAKYVPPKYGEYNYPAWIQGLGWTLVVAIFIPTIMHMIMCAVKGNKGIFNNLKNSLKPLDTWGPASDSGVENYDKQPPKRSLRDLLVFNLLGRYTRRRQNRSSTEMAPLSKA